LRSSVADPSWEKPVTGPMNLLRGTLDALILKCLAGGAMHGYGIADWVREITDGVLQIEDGALYTSLHRMQDRGWLRAEWGVSERGRRAKFYELTAAGRRRLDAEARDWARYAEAVGKVFAAGRSGS
jgi:PadR family transcriptional regulator, regulatory protein PadR